MPDGRKWTVERDGSVTDPSAEVVSPGVYLGRHPHGPGGGPRHPQGRRKGRQLLRHTHPRRPRRAHAAEPAPAGQHRQRQGGPADTGAGHKPQPPRQMVPASRPAFLAAVNRAKPATFEEMARLWYKHNHEGYDNWRECAATHYDGSRYHLLNLHAAFSTERPAHTIEFRAFNGTLHAGEIKAYIQLCLAISHQALKSSAARPHPPQHGQPEVHLQMLAPPAGLHRRRVRDRAGTPAQAAGRQRGLATGRRSPGLLNPRLTMARRLRAETFPDRERRGKPAQLPNQTRRHTR